MPEDRLDMEFGFTENRYPGFATLLLNEELSEERDTKTPLFVGTLDMQKAFDVVPHDLLMHKLFRDGFPGTWWMMKNENYHSRTTKLIWCGQRNCPQHDVAMDHTRRPGSGPDSNTPFMDHFHQ